MTNYIEGEDRIVREIANQLCIIDGINPSQLRLKSLEGKWAQYVESARRHLRMERARQKANEILATRESVGCFD